MQICELVEEMPLPKLNTLSLLKTNNFLYDMGKSRLKYTAERQRFYIGLRNFANIPINPAVSTITALEMLSVEQKNIRLFF